MQGYKKELGSGNPSSSHNNNTVLITSNDEMGNIIKIVKSLEDSGLLLNGVTETVQNEVKEQKGGFIPSMLLGTLSAALLGNFLTGKGIYRAGKGKGINRATEGIIRAGYGNNSSKMDFQFRLIFQQTLKFKNIMKMNQNLMVFIPEIIYPK